MIASMLVDWVVEVASQEKIVGEAVRRENSLFMASKKIWIMECIEWV